MKRPVRLAVALTREERRLWIEVKGETEAAALADVELTRIIKDGWKIKHTERIADRLEVALYIKSRGEAGATWEELIAEFNVKSTNMVVPLDTLRLGHAHGDGPYPLDEYTAGDQIVMQSRGVTSAYVAAAFAKKQPRGEPKKADDYIDKPTKSATVTFTREEPVAAPVAEMSKAEGKRQRKSIIEKASAKQIQGDGFVPEFMTHLTDLERQYLTSLNQFNIRLMLTEIKKKP